MAEKDREKTAFATPDGLYRFRKLSFGLTNAPACFTTVDSGFSDSGLGAVLSQVQGGKERVITYIAHALSKAERNYSTTRKELLALVWGMEHLETFLCG